MNTSDHHFDSIGEQINGEAATFAKAALGIPEGARVHTLDVTSAALFIHMDHDGLVTSSATISKRDAARALRYVADGWDRDWKAEEHAAQKAKRDGGKS